MTICVLRCGVGALRLTQRLSLHSALSRRCQSSIVGLADENYSAGQNVKGYTIEKVSHVSELSLTAVLLTHDNTRAQHLHIARDDANNVFGVAFRTTPRDDTGVPHILEHTALCGSHKFPVRDPFFKMLTRSLNTFMNAFTASDWTMYPFSTQNPQDYSNLMSVYLDAAFFPRLRELDFMQEGWRLEHENPQDPDSPIVFKGVVYNEMKGVFSTAANLYSQKCQNLLLPSHTYSTVYGGDPDAITGLTWQQLRDFHASHYHPSNARFYTYGNLPLEDHLEFISTQALNKFSKIDPNTEVPSEPRWGKPREATMTCMPDPMAPDPNKQSTVSVSYLMGDVTDTLESFVLSLLGYLLVSTEKAPFYQSLLESNIGSDFSPVLGYDNNTRDSTFSVGLQGIHADDVDKVKAIIEDTIDKVIREGFEQERIDALLHKIELGLKHQTETFGLNLGVSVLPSWIHNGDPMTLLDVTELVKKFKRCLAENPKFLQEKTEQYFKKNAHKLTLSMHPDENFEAQRQKQEDSRLQQKVAALSDAERKAVYEKGVELLAVQMEEPDVSCLPTLQLSDINPTAERVTLQTADCDGTSVQLCSQPTNGVTYFRAALDISSLKPGLLPYVPLFCTVLTRMGAGEWDYRDLSEQIDLRTGGLTASPNIVGHPATPNNIEQGLVLSSHCLNKNADNMFELWEKIFNSLDLSDSGRLTTLVMMTAAQLANSLAGAGHQYAMTHAASTVNLVSAIQEQLDGITQVALMKSVAESSDVSPVLEKLQAIASHVLSEAQMRCAVNSNPENLDDALRSTETFLRSVKDKRPKSSGNFFKEISNFEPRTSCFHFEMPFQVNYLGKCVPGVPYAHDDFASLRILASMMGSRYLHREIREKGGAYGGGAVGSAAGQFSFFSYRDPNSERTLEAFDGATKWASEGKFSQQDIDESKLAVFAKVDAPVPPGSRGMREFLSSISHDTYQGHRQRLFAVNKDSLVSVAQKYVLKPDLSSVSLLGPENPLSKDSDRWQSCAM